MVYYNETLEYIKKKLSQGEKSLQTVLDDIASGKNTLKSELALQKVSEELCNAARLLPTFLHEDAHPLIVETMEDGLDIKYEYKEDENVFIARIPSLLPKKERGSARWIRATVQATLREFVARERLNPLEGEFVVIFNHVYSHERRAMRDHDNIEVNVTMDAIALFLLKDDSPYYVDHFHCSCFGENDQTNIYLVPRTIALKYIQEVAKYGQKEKTN